MSLGEGGSFDLRARELALIQRQQEQLAKNRSLAIELINEVDGLVNVARVNAGKATLASSQAIHSGRVLLLALNFIAIVGAALIAWQFVGRVLLPRLEFLSTRMRHMADGNLEGQIEVSGHDEVAEMASALEGFRRNALKLLRMDEVERLNVELNKAFEDLTRAQDQIVAREKLAALGELTAGAAHEIQNPLNFVVNFSEASEDLLTELQENLPDSGNAVSEEQRETITETTQLLAENLQRICNHGQRAARLVTDMLLMGGDSETRQFEDINALLVNSFNLAFQNVKIGDPDIQLLDIKKDLDPNTGELEVVSQNLSRVFLNMITNSCYAVGEKRKAQQARAATTAADAGGEQPAAPSGPDYQPTLWLTTRRLNDKVEIRIKDNGGGIPPDVVEEIFEPFFTTKPTDEGTGLGLSMSNDIVREHGGTIEVNSVVDDFTEMVVTIPDTAGMAAGPAETPALAPDNSEEPEDVAAPLPREA